MPYAELNPGASALKSPNTAEPSADSEQMALCKMIKSWYAEAKKHREKWDKNWQKYMDAYNSHTWDTQKNKGKQTPEMNIIRPLVQTIIPILTDHRPGFDVNPRQPNDFKFVKMIGELIPDIWDKNDMQIKIVELLMEAVISDVGITKVVWNEDFDDGLGDVEIEVKDKRNIYVNPGAIDFERDCKYVIEVVRKTVGEWRMLFPEFAEKIKADKAGEKAKTEVGAAGDGTVTLVSPVDRDENKDKRVGEGESQNKEVEGFEVWFVDDTVEEYVKQNEKSGEEETLLKKKYPDGRLVTILPWQNLVLQDVSNPNEGEFFNPYVKFSSNIIPHSFYGEGDVKSQLEIQKILNKLVQLILENTRLMANPYWILDKNSGVNKDRITNKVGLIIEKNPGTEVKRESAEGLPTYIFQFLEFVRQFADYQSGINDVTQGRKPLGITAAEAIESLQEAAHTRIRLKERNMEPALMKTGKKVVNMMLQNYTGVRYQNVSEEGQEIPNFVKFNMARDENGFSIQRQNVIFNPSTGEYVESDTIEEAQATKGPFDIKVRSGTSLPLQKSERARTAFKLFELGIIDEKEVLETVEWPNATQVLERIKEKQRLIQEQQQQGVVQNG